MHKQYGILHRSFVPVCIEPFLSACSSKLKLGIKEVHAHVWCLIYIWEIFGLIIATEDVFMECVIVSMCEIISVPIDGWMDACIISSFGASNATTTTTTTA